MPYQSRRTCYFACDHCGIEVAAEGPEPTRPLSPREMDVLALLAMGATQKEIGRELSISVQTVKNHLTTIYGLFGVHTSGEAVAAWRGEVPYSHRQRQRPS